MTVGWWYLRRGVAWSPVLGGCAAGVAIAVMLARWPSTAFGLLPVLLACCAGAAAFLFDERGTAVVAVTPRGATWRRTARLTVAVLPLSVWTTVVLLRPGNLPLERSGWWLVGAAGIGTVSGLAALASRRQVAAPGSILTAVVTLTAVGPVVVSAFLGWDSVYPLEGFATGVWTFWLTVAAVGAVACGLALRPGIRG